MANGPSLTQSVADKGDELKRTDTMSVNFAPVTPMFFDIRPRYHILADPLFFDFEALPKARDIFEALCRVDWPLTLLVPAAVGRPHTADRQGQCQYHRRTV